VVYMYYVYVEAWCLEYAWQYLVGAVHLSGPISEQVRAAGEFFGETTGTSTNGVIHISALFWLIVVTLNIALVYRGLSGGIEKLCQFALPSMAVLAIIVLIRVLTLGTPDPAHPDQNVLNGLDIFGTPIFQS
jgi:neurotransmitter:Na+ symporter, NSS family